MTCLIDISILILKVMSVVPFCLGSLIQARATRIACWSGLALSQQSAVAR